MSLNTRAIATTAALALAGSLCAAAPADATTETGSQIAATSYRTLNVPGLPITVQAPASWPAFSPKTLVTQSPSTYPKAVISVAKAQKKTPAAFIKQNKDFNLMSYGGVNTRSYAAVNVADYGKKNWTVAGVKGHLKGNKRTTIQTTSTVRTKFGTVYRVHYRSSNAAGYKYYGVMSLVNLKGNKILVDNTSSSANDSLDMSNRTLSSADWR